jgi:hypothetical protein
MLKLNSDTWELVMNDYSCLNLESVYCEIKNLSLLADYT